MNSMFFLTLIIVLVSGLIAYIGDWIGRKMGRKRLTMLGLRPRYTAIVISVGIGMLIAALTLTATFAVNKRVRDAFFTPIEHLRSELTYLRSELHASQDLTVTAKTTLNTRTRELLDTEVKSRKITDQLTNEQHKFQDKQLELNTFSTRLDSVKRQLSDAQKKYQEVNNQLKDANDSVKTAKTSIKDSTQKLLKMQTDIQSLTFEKANLEAAIGELALANFAPLTFEQGQEILSGLFPTIGTEMTLHKSLEQFFKAADKVVHQRSPDMPATDSALLFYRKPISQNEQLVALSLDEAISLLTERIRKSNTPERVLVQLVPSNNVRVNGPAMIVIDNLRLLPNNKIFEAGGEVAHIQISEHTSQAAILGKLADELLREIVPKALREKQMPMIIRRFDPNIAGQISTTQSMVSWGHLLTATEEVRKQHGTVVVTVRANKTLRRFDPLDLTFDVTPAKP